MTKIYGVLENERDGASFFHTGGGFIYVSTDLVHFQVFLLARLHTLLEFSGVLEREGVISMTVLLPARLTLLGLSGVLERRGFIYISTGGGALFTFQRT